MRLLYATLVFGLAVAVASRADSTTNPSVSAEILVLADAPEVTLQFRVSNTGATEVVQGTLGKYTNTFYVLYPDGTIYESGGASVDPPWPRPATKEARKPVIATGEQFIWELRARELIRIHDQPGMYRIYWRFGDSFSDEIRLHRRPGLTLEGQPLAAEAPLPPTAGKSPRERLVRFFKAMDGDDDEPRIDLGMDETNKLHRDIALQLHQRAAAARRFRDAVKRRFGADAVNAGWFYEASKAESLREVDEAKVTFPKYFLEAVVEPKEWNWKVRLIRSGERWTVSADNFIKRGVVDPGLMQIIKALERTTDEIEQGKLLRVRDARDAMRLRIWENKEPPATDPEHEL